SPTFTPSGPAERRITDMSAPRAARAVARWYSAQRTFGFWAASESNARTTRRPAKATASNAAINSKSPTALPVASFWRGLHHPYTPARPTQGHPSWSRLADFFAPSVTSNGTARSARAARVAGGRYNLLPDALADSYLAGFPSNARGQSGLTRTYPPSDPSGFA